MLPHREGSCTNSTSVSSCLRQCGHLLLLFLKLKAWRFVFIVVPLLLLVSNLLVLPWLVRLVSVKEIKKHLVFYGARDFASSQAKVLIDRSAFNNEAVSASSIIANGGGHDSWIEDCRPLINCKERFIHQTDAAIVAHLRYSSTPESARSVLDCLDRDSSHLMCAFLYYVMVNSMHPRSQHQTMKTVQLFEMHNNRQLERLDEDRSLENAKLNLSLPLSACTGWINEGLFARLVEFGAAYLVAFAAIGVTFYLLISTISCIHILKTDGFLQQLFRSGLSVSAYWLAVWIITLVECLVFAGVFTASNAMQCPGVYSAAAIAQTFTFAVLFCLNLAASMLLLKTLLPSMLMTSILAMLLNAGLVLAFSNHEYLVRKASFVPYLFPPMFGKEYLAGRLSSEVERLRTGLNLPEDEAGRFSNIIAANIVSLLLQMLLLAYLDFLVKNGNGLCLPPCYPIMIEFWLPRLLQDQGKASSDRSDVAESEPHIEPVMGMAQIVVVDEVSKSYCDCWACCDETPHVLKHVTCRIYRGQITALIGHNGAGKSTLIKILTGEELPDTGTAHIDGCLVTNPLLRLALRGRISICPQFDALCDSLTVMECIRVTLTSRAVSDSSQLERARGMLQRLGLGDKENVLSCDLSGGQKRKVSTILALLGDPDVVFLDEPTSGLDPVSRRQLWQLLQEEKSSRSIILCTQFMDEADILADRKIFLCGGQIVCAGSSMFLKRAFGCSFILNVSLKTKAAARTLLAKLNQVRVKSLVETELQLEIPSLNSAVLTEAIQVLETSEEIVAFGLSQASLDDIFMRLSGMDSDDIIKAFPLGTLTLSQTPELSENSAPDVETEIKEPMLETCHIMKPSVMRQFGALLSVNLKRQLRVQSSFLSRIFVPVALLALIGVFSTVFSGSVMRRIDDPINSQMDILTTHSNIRTSDFGSTPLAAACVIDEQQKAFHTEHCEALALTRVEDGRQPIVIQKSPSQSMKEFVSQSSTREKLLQGLRMNGWIETDGSMTPCVVYYASSWLKNVSNKERAISVGVFIGADNRHATVHIYRRALSKVLKLFNFTDVENTTALSFVRPFGTSTIISLSMTAFFFAFSLFPVSFLNDPIEDMSSRVRSYLVSTGMSHLAYWINTFIMHWVQYAFFFLIAVTFLMISEAYRSAHLILTAFLPAYVFGTVSNLMTIYAVAVVTRTKSTVVSLCCDLFVAILPMAFIILNSPVALQLLIWLLPPAAPLGLLYCSTVYYFYKREFYQSTDTAALPGMPESIYQNPTILHSLVAMPVHIMIMCGVISMVENRHIIRGSLSTTSSTKAETMRPLNPDSDMDEGARMEAERVLGTPRNRKNVLEVRRLRQTHSNGVRAVRGVTFGAMAGEIFGLLGTNGAGKSTTMSVIVGEEAALEGVCEVYMHNYAWVSGREAATIGVIGYCPQHNPLFHSITVAEHLKFYADIRGLDSGESERQKNRLMISLGLAQYRDKQAGQLSGGNKRRLCLAIALLGNPSLVMIDEASTGVDPENKRSIWGAIRCMMHQQRSIIITTHSMEEVEALCSRVGIMNKGRIIAVGTVQQLRSLYGDEYTLELLLKSEAESAVQQKKKAIEKTVKEYFSGAQNQEDLGLGLVMQFSVPKSSVPSLSGALKWLEANQSRLGVSCWALCQMSLDQVFVKLVKKYDQSAQKLGIEARSGFST